MQVGFIGCVDSSRASLKTLLNVKGLSVVAVVTRDSSTVNSDFCDLTDICIENSIPYHYENPNLRSESIDFLKQYDLDAIFCIGWSYLLDLRILNLTKLGVIGFHPARLPQNRGRHPIIWALALGLTKTASTFFLMDEGADSGPIVSQEDIKIDRLDDATSLYQKIVKTSQKQLKKIGHDLVNGTIKKIEQNHNQATYWRKRIRNDGIVDFRMSANNIYNLIRALAPPYPGAEFIFNNEHIKIPKSKVCDFQYDLNIEPGKVIKKKENDLLVKVAGTQAIWLHGLKKNNIEAGDYL